MKKYTLAQIYATTYVLSHNAARYIKARITHPEWFKKKKIIKLKKRKRKIPKNTTYHLRPIWDVALRLLATVVVMLPLTLMCSPQSKTTVDFIIAVIASFMIAYIICNIYAAVKMSKKYPRYGCNHNEETQSKYGKVGETQC